MKDSHSEAMTDTGRRIAKNVSALLGSQLTTLVISMILVVLLPRYLGAVSVGRIYLATSIWSVIGVFVTFGMDTLLTKEVARNPNRVLELFGTVVITRTVLYVLGLAALVVYLAIAPYPPESVYVILIVGASSLVLQFISASQAVLEGLERMEYISLSSVVGKLANLFLCLALLLLKQSVYWIAAALIVAYAMQLAVQVISLRRLLAFRLHFDPALVRWVLRAGFPYLLAGGVLSVYQQVDVIIVSLLADETAVGWYGAALRLTGTLMFVPTILVTAVFPVFSRLHATDSESLAKVFRKSFVIMLLLGVPIGLGVLVIADQLTPILFGPEFSGGAPVLAIMGIVLVSTYQNTLIGRFLISTNRQNTWTSVMIVALAMTVALDLLLIPWCQRVMGNAALGGALSYLVTELGMTVAGLKLLPRNALDRSSAWIAVRILCSGALMAVVAWFCREMLIVIPVVLGAACYVCLLILLRAVPREDMQMARDLISSALGRIRPGQAHASGVS